MMNQISILVYDKEVLFAGLLQILVEEHAEFNLAGIANSDERIFEILTSQIVDVVILVQSYPQENILALLKEIKENFSRLKLSCLAALMNKLTSKKA